MKNNFIQMGASAGQAVAYMIDLIFKHIIDCVQLYFTNSFTNILHLSVNYLWLVGVTLIFNGTPHIIVQRCQIVWLIMRSSKTGCKISSVALAVCYVAPFCCQMLPISSSSIFVKKKFVEHVPITIDIDCNGLSLLISNPFFEIVINKVDVVV